LSSAGTSGQTLYIKIAEATAKEFRVGHQALIRDEDDYRVDVNAKVTDVVKNGTSSYVAVKLLEADDNSADYDLSTAGRSRRILVIGNVNAEGAVMPDAISYQPTKIYNYTQIFRSPLELTRTAKLTKLRTGDAYQKAKREALEMHAVEMEKAFIWGIRTENVGDNGKPERTTRGLIDVIKNYASVNVSDYTLDTTYSGATWLDKGEEWFDNMLEQMFRYGNGEKLAICGSGALLGINRLIKANGNFEFKAETAAYGIKITKWTTAFGDISLVTHPLFSYEPTNRYSMIILEPEQLKFRYITDTTFYGEGEKQNTGNGRIDGIKEEYLTEAGLEFHLPNGWGYLNGVGKDNELP